MGQNVKKMVHRDAMAKIEKRPLTTIKSGVVFELEDGREIEVTPYYHDGGGVHIRGLPTKCCGRLVIEPLVSNCIVVRFLEDAE